MRVAVVGGGVAGASVAWALARRGTPPLLLDASPSGADGASRVPVALLNPYRGRAGHAHPDDVAGLATTLRWARALHAGGLRPGLHEDGVLRVPTDARQARAWQRRAQAEGAGAAVWWPPSTVPAPYLAPHGALYVRRGGWLEPGRWLRALSEALHRDGGRRRNDARVTGFEESTRGVRLHLADGGVVEADRVVWCLGADACPDGRTPTLEPRAGDVATLEGAPAFPHPLAGPTYGTHAGGGVAYVGGHHRPPDAPRPPDAGPRLRQSIARTVPGVGQARVKETWSGVRAHTADTRPLQLDLGVRSHFVGAFGGRGFLCAADVAERFATRLVGDGAGSESSRPPGERSD